MNGKTRQMNGERVRTNGMGRGEGLAGDGSVANAEEET